MGVLAAALALAFMHFHWGLKKVYLRLGLHVSVSQTIFERLPLTMLRSSFAHSRLVL